MADKKIYTVATSHLDTVWSWDFETTVSKYIYNTLVDNFRHLKHFSEIFFSAIRILMKSLEKEVLISTCLTVSALVGHFRLLSVMPI